MTRYRWTGRSDGPGALRIHEVVQHADNNTDFAGATALIGFACDVGVHRNQGRAGAAEGPRALRDALANLPVHFSHNLIDMGDVVCVDDDLEKAQQELASLVERVLRAGGTTLGLGGGHEVAWGHYQGIAAAFPNKRLGIVNVDAHLDLRPLLPGNLGTSGTSFLQIAQHRPEQFDYLCIGVQRFGNTAALFKIANDLKASLVLADEVNEKALPAIHQLIARSDIVYVTVCMDVFAAAFAPGVSAPQPLGLLPRDVIPLLRALRASHKVIAFDIAEVCPALDRDHQTAKLAAALISEAVLD